jgi:hypothetical protein
MIILITLSLVGLFDAVMDKIQFHYNKSIFKNFKNQQFWNPKLSWINKWKNGNKKNGEKFLFSSTLFVFTTDAWHLAKFFRNFCIVVSMFLFIYLPTNPTSIFYLVLGRVFWGIVFELCFSRLFGIK